MTDNEVLKWLLKDRVEAASGGRKVLKGGPSDHAAESDTIVKSHQAGVELCP